MLKLSMHILYSIRSLPVTVIYMEENCATSITLEMSLRIEPSYPPDAAMLHAVPMADE